MTTRAKFYTIHRDSSETLAPISRGKWVKPRNKTSTQNSSNQSINMIPRKVTRDMLISVREATSASRSRWFRGY